MRKNLALLFTSVILLISANCLSQTPLTNGQVHDYEVGDIMQTITDWHGFPTVYSTSTILSKFYSTNKDTISYIRKMELNYFEIFDFSGKMILSGK